MTDYRPQLKSALSAAARVVNRRLMPQEILDTCQPVVEAIVAEAVKAAKKERAKAQVDPRAHSIFNVYPRREGGRAALVAVSKAIEAHGFDLILEKTAEYARAVARWPMGRKRDLKGGSLIPMPTTFFGNARYLDDTAQWWEGTGGKEANTAPKVTIPEPIGWRFAFPESTQVRNNTPWEHIDMETQKYIATQMAQKENSA